MIKVFRKWFGIARDKKIAFLDGDRPLPGIIDAYKKYLIGTETHLVRAYTESKSNREPHILRHLGADINKIYLSGYSTGKEIVDKFIAAYIQKALQDGYTHITVVSSGYDFIDIFKMAVTLNPGMSKVMFRMIVPRPQGRLDESMELANIEIVKM